MFHRLTKPGSARRVAMMRAGAAGCVGVAALAVTLATPASAQAPQARHWSAQPPSRLGAGPVEPPAAVDPAPSGEQQHRQRQDVAADNLLVIARRDRVEGRPEIAQRVLELLIARYPDSPASEAARRDLYALYAADPRINKAAPSAAAQPAPAAGAATVPAPTAGRWQTTVVAHRRLQDDLRLAVGDRLFFEAGTAELGSRASDVVAAQAEWLLARPDVVVTVEGHADDAMVGVDNERIALARATAVRNRLIGDGVPEARLQVTSFGARDRLAICEDGTCAFQNRRVILKVGVRRQGDSGNSGTAATQPPARAGQVR